MKTGFKGSIDEYIVTKKRESKQFSDEYDQEDIRLKIAVTIAQQRRAAHLTQAQLAGKAGLPQSTVARVELGNSFPSSRTLQAIASALNKTPKFELV